MSSRFLVIDGHSLAFRAFYALPLEAFTSSSGQPTNAVYGFLSMLTKMLETDKPDYVAVAFDLSSHSFRTDEYPEYKGTREKTPEEFKGQIDLIREVLSAMGISSLTKENYEADDILATLAHQAAEDGMEVLVASGDRDTFQLINEQVTVIYPGRTPSDLKYMDPAAVEEKYGVPPEQYPEIAAIVGETSDNLPGVPGVGVKTAAQWITKFGDLDTLIDRADELGGKRGVAFRECIELIRRNRRLNRLVTDLDLPITISQCDIGPINVEELEPMFDSLEFTGLRKRIYSAFGVEVTSSADDQDNETANVFTAEDLTLVKTNTDVGQWLSTLGDSPISVVGSGRFIPYGGDIEAMALQQGSRALVFDAVNLTAAQEQALADFWQTNPDIIVFSGKALHHGASQRGWELPQPIFDIELAAYLARPEKKGYTYEDLFLEYLNWDLDNGDSGTLFDLEALNGSGSEELPSPQEQALIDRAGWQLALKEPLIDKLKKQQVLPILEDMELPAQQTLTHMESVGIAMDSEALHALADEFSHEVQAAAKDAYEAIGRQVNLASPKQLQGILFDELAMPKTRRTKTGWTTDAEALAELYSRTQHPFLSSLLHHRDRTKLLQMVETLISEIRDDGRIHTTFHQTVAATGRLASSDPNLQNIPARTDAGVRIRDSFIAGEGYDALMSVDYSQIEMRIMAHLSKDEDLVAAFNSGEDLHQTMASMVFDIPVDQVTPHQRNRTKATSYGLAYGLSQFGLSRQLGISVEEAGELRDRYFERFGGVQQYLQDVVKHARGTGYTETMFGRRRYFPQLRQANRKSREMAERAALNAPIQGTAADIIKIAMVAVENRLQQEGFHSRILLQVHDELVLEVVADERAALEGMLREEMSNPIHLSVPLEVSIGYGKSWRDAEH